MDVTKRFRNGSLSLVAAIAFTFSVSLIAPDVAKAAGKPCSLATLNGSYGFYRSGNTPTGSLAAVGIVTFDGNGNGSTKQTIARGNDPNDPNQLKKDQTGTSTYVLNADCTGSLSANGVEGARLVVVNDGAGIYALSETPGNTVYAVFEKIGKK